MEERKMMKNSVRKILMAAFSVCFVLSFAPGCKSGDKPKEAVATDFIIRDFIPLDNWHRDSNDRENNSKFISKSIFLDYTNAFEQGFIIPTVNQLQEGQFEFSFLIKNTSKTPKKFCFKIFYQNESYKFPETDPADTTKQNMYAWENFYGSWEDTGKTFVETPEIPADNDFHAVTGRFRITGNPRNELRYYSGAQNDRWKRNPRVGWYSFMLVVTTPANITGKVIPDYMQDISRVWNNTFVNPYFYFLHGEGKSLQNTVAMRSPSELKVIAKPDPGAGIYVKPMFFHEEKDKKYFCKTCGQSEELYKNAPFEQFIHYIDPTTKMNNIPVIADVLNEGYSLMDYNWNKQFYRKEELVAVTASTTKYPCQTVASVPEEHKITIKNPGCEYGNWQKQNVGIITRHGLTYGKWTVKAKLTELLNKDNMWNGLTNAIWLITQEQSEWNYRRDCNKEGYMANYYGGAQDKRVPKVGYSEIDFEILKTVPYCPSYILPPAYNHGLPDPHNLSYWNVPLPEEVVADGGNIEVSCTNWDMACWEPQNFADGCNTIQYNGQTFWAHRWDKGYRALTEKTPEPDDELFGSKYYYFQIDWRPEEIIWRIGPSLDRLRVVGYLNSTVSSIPNNQMLLIVTQEFHNTKWWVGSMYDQANIPFPKNDIPGEIYEVTVE
ncbi:MAG: hypothetical protein Q8867_03280 [Bacteroidota bacterium]|nr:hypothetical protein [Bacteroidota bacterium]